MIFFVFLTGALLFSLLQLNPSFPDPDSFYHARIAAEMVRGPILSFSALPDTVLSNIFIDHHFLYHILLIPFVTFFNPLVGIKVATVVFASLFLAFFYWLLHRTLPQSRVSALFFLSLLVLNSVFLFRINLAKIPAVSLIVFFAGITAIVQKRHGHLFGLSFLYVWLYAGWPLLPLSSLIAWGIQIVQRWWDGGLMENVPMQNHGSDTTLKLFDDSLSGWGSGVPLKRFDGGDFGGEGMLLRRFDGGSPKSKWHTLTTYTSLLQTAKKILPSLGLPLASFSGALAGLIINPYFPTNILFYWVQTFKIAVVNIVTEVPVGNEWYSAGATFIPLHGPTLILLVFSLCAFLFPGLFVAVFRTALPRRTTAQWFLFVLTVLFFALTLKSRRYGEYFAPLATFFSFLVLAPCFSKERAVRLWRYVKESLRSLRTARGIVVLYFIFAIPIIIGANVSSVAGDFRDGYRFSQYADGMRWLKSTVPDDARILHNRWDDFPLFYYHAPGYRYTSGLDPRFLYEKNQKLAKEYTTFSTGNDLTETFGYRNLCAVASSSLHLSDAQSLFFACTPRAEKTATEAFIASLSPSAVVITHLDEKLQEKIRLIPGFKEAYRDSEMIIFLRRTELDAVQGVAEERSKAY